MRGNSRGILSVYLGIGILMFGVVAAGCDEEPRSFTPHPEYYDGYLVLMANAVIDPAVVPLGIDGEAFHRQIMRRDDAEYEAYRQEAADFFLLRFGVDVTDPGIWFHTYQVQPLFNYRAFTISGEDVPSSGWEVRDGGWEVRVINPEGYDLGGQFRGVHVPPGSFITFGDYNIPRDVGMNQTPTGDDIIIHYEAREPTVPVGLGFSFPCELESDDYGEGRGYGLMAPEPSPDGRLQIAARNVLTFSYKGGL